MNKRMTALGQLLGIEETKIKQQRPENNRWYEAGEHVYRVLIKEELKEEALEEIHDCWYDWRYRIDELSEGTGISKEELLPYEKDGWVWSLPEFVSEHIYNKVGEEQFEHFLLKKYEEENNIGMLLDKETNEEKRVGEYYIYQWC